MRGLMSIKFKLMYLVSTLVDEKFKEILFINFADICKKISEIFFLECVYCVFLSQM
jgi:hypothetical protein